ncbi:hypothetical protein ACH432_33805, partial [Streptomyces jumonjinensis]
MTIEDFRPTHIVPNDGLPAWQEPDVSRPTEPLDPLLPVRLLDRRGEWSRILCANGWSAWVDGRLLVPVPQDPPAAGLPLARTADLRPLLDRVAEALARYRSAVDELADDRIDGETFRGRTRGLRVGAVVDGESVWLFDAEHERWVYGDGRSVTTYAVPGGSSGGSTAPDPPAADTGGSGGAAAPASGQGPGPASVPPSAPQTAPPQPAPTTPAVAPAAPTAPAAP